MREGTQAKLKDITVLDLNDVFDFLEQKYTNKGSTVFKFKDLFEIKTKPSLNLAWKKGLICCRCSCYCGYAILQQSVETQNNYFRINFYTNKQKSRMLTVDHIIPKAKGGKNSQDNYQPMCNVCNSEKSDSLEDPLYYTRKKMEELIKQRKDLCSQPKLILSHPQLRGARPCLT